MKETKGPIFSWAVLSLVFGLAIVPAATGAAEPWKAPAEAKGYQNTIAPSAQSIAAGKALFLKFCTRCHGEDGSGKGPTALSLNVIPADFRDKARMNQADGELAWKILSGRDVMPSWAPVLQEEQVWNLVNYIRQFAK
ncbi:MAG: cytochrome c [bacterium]